MSISTATKGGRKDCVLACRRLCTRIFLDYQEHEQVYSPSLGVADGQSRGIEQRMRVSHCSGV